MKRLYKNLIPVAAISMALGMASCTSDLDVEPLDPNMSTEVSVEGLFNKCYANIAMAGNGGANVNDDGTGLDGVRRKGLGDAAPLKHAVLVSKFVLPDVCAAVVTGIEYLVTVEYQGNMSAGGIVHFDNVGMCVYFFPTINNRADCCSRRKFKNVFIFCKGTEWLSADCKHRRSNESDSSAKYSFHVYPPPQSSRAS